MHYKFYNKINEISQPARIREEMPVKVYLKCRNFLPSWHPVGKQFTGIKEDTYNVTMHRHPARIWRGVLLFPSEIPLSNESDRKDLAGDEIQKRCDSIRAPSLLPQETSPIHGEQQRHTAHRCDSLQGAQIRKMRNATSGNKAAIVLKMKLQCGFFKCIVCSVCPI